MAERNEPEDTRKLFAKDLAKLQDVSERTARRRLHAMRERYGDGVVGIIPGKGTEKVQLYTTLSALETTLPRKPKTHELFDRVSMLEDVTRETERRANELEDDVVPKLRKELEELRHELEETRRASDAKVARLEAKLNQLLGKTSLSKVS